MTNKTWSEQICEACGIGLQYGCNYHDTFCLADCYDDFKDHVELYKQIQLVFQANISYIEVEIKEDKL